MNPLDVVREAYAAFGRGDLPRVLGLGAEDVDGRYLGPAAAPFAGRFDGPGGVKRFFETYVGAMRLSAFEPRRFLAEGDTVVVLGSESGTVAASGKAFTLEWAHVFVVRGGLIASFREFPDATALDAALRP